MGLDMYLKREIYVGGKYEHVEAEGKISFKGMRGDKVTVKAKAIDTITLEVAYWRKSNQIHKWFVDNVQEGNDDCGNYDVSGEALIQLRELCVDTLKSRDGKALPPAKGFFFGSDEIDEYYWQDLEETVKMLKDIDPGEFYTYHSSW